MFRALARKNQQLSMEDCVGMLKTERRGVLSVLGDEGYPYGMPMNHWYDEDTGVVWFHCGKTGHRLDALKACSKASFCVYDQGQRNEGEWAWKVKSVIVFGRVEVIDDPKKVAEITTKLSYQFTQDEEYIQGEIRAAAHKTLLLRLLPEHICGKLVTEA